MQGGHTIYVLLTHSDLQCGQPQRLCLAQALPATSRFTLSDPKFRLVLHRCLGLLMVPGGAPTVTCFCSTPLDTASIEHTYGCPIPNALDILCHDSLRSCAHTIYRGAYRASVGLSFTRLTRRCSSCVQSRPTAEVTDLDEVVELNLVFDRLAWYVRICALLSFGSLFLVMMQCSLLC
jgi:hypothetical protein